MPACLSAAAAAAAVAVLVIIVQKRNFALLAFEQQK
jgi:hypothetical protein